MFRINCTSLMVENGVLSIRILLILYCFEVIFVKQHLIDEVINHVLLEYFVIPILTMVK